MNWVLASISLDYIGRPREAVRGFQVPLLPACRGRGVLRTRTLHLDGARPFSPARLLPAALRRNPCAPLTGRGQHPICEQTVLRLGPTPRIASWVDIYMLSALVKVGQVRRALYRYRLLVGDLAPYVPRAATARGVRASVGQGVGGDAMRREWSVDLPARHTGSGWLWDPFSKRAIRLNMHTRALESHASFFEAALHHRRAFLQLRGAHSAPASAGAKNGVGRESESGGGGWGGPWGGAGRRG